jgi:hypothetical protein
MLPKLTVSMYSDLADLRVTGAGLVDMILVLWSLLLFPFFLVFRFFARLASSSRYYMSSFILDG